MLHSIRVVFPSVIPTSIDVVVGTTIWNKGGVHHNVVKTILHEDYKTDEYAYDIGLVKLAKPVTFNKKVQPIKYSAKVVLPKQALYTSGNSLVLSFAQITNVYCFTYKITCDV